MAPQLVMDASDMPATLRDVHFTPADLLAYSTNLTGPRVWLPRVGYHIARVIGAAPVASVVTIVVLVASVFPVTKTLSISIFHNRLGPVLLALFLARVTDRS